MTEPTTNERLARMEASLSHIVTAVDKAAGHREQTLERLARVEQRVQYIEAQIPQVEQNTRHGAENDGWRSAKEDEQLDTRARLAIGVSVLALFTSVAQAIRGFFQ